LSSANSSSFVREMIAASRSLPWRVCSRPSKDVVGPARGGRATKGGGVPP
jgi:hypothetical protein